MNTSQKYGFVSTMAITASILLTGCASPEEFGDGAAKIFGAVSIYTACGILESTPYGEDLIRQFPALIDFAESAVSQDSKWEAFLESLKDAEQQATIAKDGVAAASSIADAVKACAENR